MRWCWWWVWASGCCGPPGTSSSLSFCSSQSSSWLWCSRYVQYGGVCVCVCVCALSQHNVHTRVCVCTCICSAYMHVSWCDLGEHQCGYGYRLYGSLKAHVIFRHTVWSGVSHEWLYPAAHLLHLVHHLHDLFLLLCEVHTVFCVLCTDGSSTTEAIDTAMYVPILYIVIITPALIQIRKPVSMLYVLTTTTSYTCFHSLFYLSL